MTMIMKIGISLPPFKSTLCLRAIERKRPVPYPILLQLRWLAMPAPLSFSQVTAYLFLAPTIRISRLPESFGTPITWSAAELSELQYPHLEREVQEQRNEWKGFHSSLKASSAGCGVTEEELSWAMGVAYSRAFRQGFQAVGLMIDNTLFLVGTTCLATRLELSLLSLLLTTIPK